MFIINFCFLTIFSKFRNQIILNSKNNSGIDMRYPESTDFNKTLNFKINQNYYKYNLLKKLESNKISELNKLELLKNSPLIESDMYPNITAGGLFDDFNFNF